MSWVRFEHAEQVRIGKLDGGCIQPVEARDLQAVMRGEGTVDAGEAITSSEVSILAPLSPGKIIAVGQNYMDHIREQGIDPPGMPVLFPKFPTSVIGPEEEIRWPKALTGQVDYEAELAVIVGRRVRALNEENALEAVFGYANANDVSARDLQFGDGQWTRGKALDTFLPLGPSVVAADTVPDPQNLHISCRVNGDTVQQSNTSEMVFSITKLLEFISEAFTLEPGDVILTGTPNGVGFAREPQVFLNPGDTVEVEVEGLGTLFNPVGTSF